MKKVLLISEAHLFKSFIVPTIEKVKKEMNDVQFDCLITYESNPSITESFASVFDNIYINKETSFFSKIPGIRGFLRKLNLYILASKLNDYDYVHYFFFHIYYDKLVRILSKTKSKQYITFFGSDINNISKNKQKRLNQIMKHIHGIYAAHIDFLNYVNRLVNPNKTINTKLLYLETPVLVKMFHFFDTNSKSNCKEKLNIKEKRVITLGYNGDLIMQFEYLINTIQNCNADFNDTLFVFPMTYGRNKANQIKWVRENLEKLNIQYRIYDHFLPDEDILALRKSTDIFILLSSRDQGSAALYEHLAAGNYVITGKWLPYDEMEKIGLKFERIEKPESAHLTLQHILNKLPFENPNGISNSEILREETNWENHKHNWLTIYQ